VKIKVRRLAIALTAATASVLLASGCSSPSPSSAASPSTPGAASSTASASAASASGSGPAADAAVAYKGVVAAPPAAPVTAPKPGLVWVVSCGQSVPTCATPANAAVTAAKALGSTAELCDGKLNPQSWSACILQGISAKASGIIFIGQDCPTVQAALIQAKKAGIPVIGAGGNDCDVTGGTKQFAATITYLASMTNQQWWEKIGALQADWIIAKTNGQANVLSLQFTDDIWGTWIQNGFSTELATCSGCKIASVLKLGNAAVESGQLAQQFSTALLKQPAVNAINVPLDGWFLTGLAQAVKSSGRASQLSVIGTISDVGNFGLIRNDGGENATVGFSPQWTGWAGVDALVRILARQPAQPAGMGLQVIDAGHNLPASGQEFSYSPAINFESAYEKDWGVS
jgi:ribose transport system substrate-binding protein